VTEDGFEYAGVSYASLTEIANTLLWMASGRYQASEQWKAQWLNQTRQSKDYGELVRRKSEHLVLAGPFSRQVGEADNSHAMREPSFNRHLDEVGRGEGKRDLPVMWRTAWS
jgi:hypothetical protein